MKDTPRTDEVAWPETGLVEGDFARQLERELAAVTEQRDRLAEALRKCREDSVCHQRRMEDLGYTYAAKESQANSDRAYIALQSLTTNKL